MKLLPHTPTALAALLISASLPAQADDWPRFRGPNGSGIAQAAGLPTKITKELLAWSIPLNGKGHSCPVVFGEKLFYTVASEGENPQRDLVCLATADGMELWRKSFPYKTYKKHNLNSFASTTPTADARGVYVFWGQTEESEVAALDHEGKELWRTALGPYECQHGPGMSLAVEDGIVIVPKENLSADSFVAGLEAATGKILWKVQTPGELLKNDNQGGGDTVPSTTPTVRRRDGQVEIIHCNTRKGLHGIDLKTGKLLWQFDPKFRQRCIASPVLMGDLVFACAGQGSGGKESVVVAMPPGAGEAKEAYRITKGLPYVPTALFLDGLLFLGSDTGIVSCVEAKTGEELWRQRVVGDTYASPICINGLLYLFDRKGQVAVIQAGREYKVINESDLGEGVNATPAVAGGRLFIRTDERLLCLASAS